MCRMGGVLSVVIVVARDSEAYAEACQLAAAVGARLVDKLSSDLVDLRTVAKYKAVEPVVVLVVQGGTVIARIPRLPSLAELRADVARCSA